MNRIPLWGAVSAAALLVSVSAPSYAASDMLYVADPAMNMIYGHRLDGDTTNSLIPITGSATIVADSVAHLSATEAAYVPTGDRRVVLLNLESRTMETIAIRDSSLAVIVGQGTGPNDFLWYEENETTHRFAHATRNTATGEWEIAYHDFALPPEALGRRLGPTTIFAVDADHYVALNDNYRLYFHTVSTGETKSVSVLLNPRVTRSPGGQVLLHYRWPDALRVLYDPAGNEIADAPILAAPIFQSWTGMLEWRSDRPELVGVLQGGDMVAQDTLETTGTMVHSSRDENGSFIPERDITGAATLFRVAPDRWQFFNETGGLQVLNTTTHRAEYQLEYTAGSGPEFSAIEAIAMGPDKHLYVLDAGQRLFRVVTATGERQLLKTFDTECLHQFIHVRAEGTIVLVKRAIGAGAPITWRLVEVNFNGTDWVAREGTAGAAPFDPNLASLTAAPEGVYALWHDLYGMYLSDLTTAGLQNLVMPGTYYSGAPVTSDSLITFTGDIPASESRTLDRISLKWTYSTEVYPETGLAYRLRTPAGRTITIPRFFIRHTPLQAKRFAASVIVDLPEAEAAAGTWTLFVDTSGGGMAPFQVAMFKSSIAFYTDPLNRAGLLATPPAGGIKALTRFPAAVREIDGSGTPRPLGDDASLSRLSQARYDANGTLFLGASDRFALWKVNSETGLAEPLADQRPVGLDAAVVGRRGASWLKLAIGPAPDYIAAAGWMVH